MLGIRYCLSGGGWAPRRRRLGLAPEGVYTVASVSEVYTVSFLPAPYIRHFELRSQIQIALALDEVLACYCEVGEKCDFTVREQRISPHCVFCLLLKLTTRTKEITILFDLLIEKGSTPESISVDSVYIPEKSLLRVTGIGNVELDNRLTAKNVFSKDEAMERAIEISNIPKDKIEFSFETATISATGAP